MSRFSPSADQQLRAAGWFPGRRIDVAPFLNHWRTCGAPTPHSAARAFVEEFGGLHIHPADPNDASDVQVDLTGHPPPLLGFLPDILRPRPFRWQRRVLRRLNLPHDLVFVGEGGRGHTWLLMDESGRVYEFASIARPTLSLAGRSGDEMIENAVAGKVATPLNEAGQSPPTNGRVSP